MADPSAVSTPRPSLTTQQAAEFLAVAPKTLVTWRCKGRGPIYSKLGRSVIYDPDDLASFRDSHKVRVSGGAA